MFSLSRFYDRFCGAVAAVVCMAGTVSCSDELKVPSVCDDEGRETLVTLSYTVPDMKVQSRMTTEQESTVRSLWVGIYNVGTGLRTNELPKDGYYAINPVTDDFHDEGTNANDHPLPAIKTRTGASYIVAVANVTQNLGITDNAELRDALGIAKGDRSTPLVELLAAADTWEKFKSISHVLNQADNVQYMTPNLPMQGSYMSGGHPDDYEEAPEAVNIEDGKALTGKIHLRRLLAKNTFTIRGAQYVTFEPTGWQLINNPVIAYVQEQSRNAADVSDYFEGVDNPGAFKGNYANSPNSFHFEKTDGGGHMFEFYQLENKHTALEWEGTEAGGTGMPSTGDGAALYQYRDREFKMGDGANTGVFRSLVRTAGEPVIGTMSMNNRASYVVITGHVSYWIMPVAENADPGHETPVAPETAGAVQRTAYVTYTIHLGYCEGKNGGQPTAATAADFNCRRNTRYNYSVTVNGVNDIIVEAMREGENQPGAEGDVLDSTNEVLEFDAHYQVFNVQLTDEEVKSLSYEIHAPYGNETKTFLRGKEDAAPDIADNDRQFVEWVKMRPTTGSNVIASYKTTGNGDGPWTLEEMRADANSANPQHLSASGWYTVFIDEYVYHFNADGTAAPDTGNEVGQDWTKFVDKPDRTFSLIAVKRGTSSDGESTYGQYRYSVRQKSIQTYYSKSGNVAETILGAEHVNESYGLNLRWSSDVTTPTGGWNADNGRWNMWQYVGVKRNNWSRHLSMNSLMTVPDIRNNNMLPGFESNKATTYYVPQAASITVRNAGGRVKENNERLATRTWDPQPGNATFYEIMSQCLSRNRDLNGNGVIDANELRWYLPAMGKYARLVIGRNSLKMPLFDPDRITTTNVDAPYGSDGMGKLACFHYASSDNLLLMSEFGMWIERYGFNGWGGDKGGLALAWNVRCIRNLGANLTVVSDSDPVKMAYEVNSMDRTVEMKYYEGNAIRTAYYGPGHPMISHDVFAPENLPYKKFQYASQDVRSTNNTTPSVVNYEVEVGNTTFLQPNTNGWGTSVDNNTLCAQYTEEAGEADKGTWRVPNQTELTIMRRLTTTVFKEEPPSESMWCWPSCTTSYFNLQVNGNRPADGYMTTYMTIYNNNGRSGSDADRTYWSNSAWLDLGTSNTTLHLRCVRDVRE